VVTRGAYAAHMYHVIRLFSLQCCISIQMSTTPSKMGDGLIAESKHSNSTFILLYMYHERDVDYLVVDEMINISKLFDYTCMFGVSANL
jgi:hypothetical protein